LRKSVQEERVPKIVKKAGRDSLRNRPLDEIDPPQIKYALPESGMTGVREALSVPGQRFAYCLGGIDGAVAREEARTARDALLALAADAEGARRPLVRDVAG
jgi:hypothetical protein